MLVTAEVRTKRRLAKDRRLRYLRVTTTVLKSASLAHEESIGEIIGVSQPTAGGLAQRAISCRTRRRASGSTSADQISSACRMKASACRNLRCRHAFSAARMSMGWAAKNSRRFKKVMRNVSQRFAQRSACPCQLRVPFPLPGPGNRGHDLLKPCRLEKPCPAGSRLRKPAIVKKTVEPGGCRSG